MRQGVARLAAPRARLRAHGIQAVDLEAARRELLALILAVSFRREKVTLASGRESDFYLDLRQTLMRPRGIALSGELVLERLGRGAHVDAVGGMAVGAVVLLIVIFSAGWVVTSNSAKAQAYEVATAAVVDRLAPISVVQFMQDPNRVARLKELKALDSWKRADYVKEQGWATMPGEKESDYNVANECAKRLVKLEM